MDCPKLFVSYQKEESINIQRVKTFDQWTSSLDTFGSCSIYKYSV